MSRLICFLLIIPILFCSQSNVMVDLFNDVSMIEIYKDGQVCIMDEEEQEKFDEIFCNIMEGAIQLPAFAVSLDELTKEEFKEGYWIRFLFENTMFKSEMPFDELLIKITKDSYSINIIRGNNGVYQGRCYYLELKENMNELFDFISELDIEHFDNMEVELENQNLESTMIVNDEENNENKSLDNKDSIKLENGDKPNTSGTNFKQEDDKDEDENAENDTMTKSQKELLEHLK